MALDFSMSEEPVDETTHLVVITGEVDIFTAPEFKGVIATAIESDRGTVIVDLMGATFIDSSSLGVLIAAHRRLTMREGRLIICSDVPAVRNTFKITGLDTVLEITSTRDDALAARLEAKPPGDGSAAAA